MSESSYPFRLAAALGEENEPIINAADSHILDVMSLTGGEGELDGDVLAVVTFPKDFSSAKTCGGKAWREQDWHLRMSSKKLKSLGSAKINAMFEPGRQTRTRRRLRFALLPPDISYILDFSPPVEGAELADQTAALWLPKVVKLWFLAGHYVPPAIIHNGPQPWNQSTYHRRPLGDKAVGAVLALGHDDACRSDSCLRDLEQWRINPRVRGIIEDATYGSSERHIPSWRKIEDYCPIRHRAAIIRVLRAINGRDLLLNSAPRMWTVAQVAIHLEVPHVVVDPVTQWLIASPNTKFIEICPERAFQLAHSLRIPSVLLASFRILVNEFAIDYLATTPSPGRSPCTWVGRKRDDYGDFPSDPIDYAGRAMAERVTAMLDGMLSEEALDLFGVTIGHLPLREWERLRNFGSLLSQLDNGLAKPSELTFEYRKLVGSLTLAFRGKVVDALTTPLNEHMVALITAQRAHYIPDCDLDSIEDLYAKLNNYQKALTSFFWNHLKPVGRLHSFSEYAYQGSPIWRTDSRFHLLRKKAAEQAKEFADYAGGLPAPSQAEIVARLSEDVFSLPEFCEQLHTALLALCTDMLSVHDDSGIPYFLSDHLLLKLSEKEQNFLPIWADGLDDGSGGVFQESVPPAEMGPSEPGPAYHTGYTIATDTNATETDCASTIAPSDLAMDRLGIYSDGGSVVRSMDAQQSVTTGIPRGRVVAASESIASEHFTPSDTEFRDAMFAEPAPHQALGNAIARYVEDDPDEAGTVGTSVRDGGDDADEAAWSDIGSSIDGAIKPPVRNAADARANAQPASSPAGPSGIDRGAGTAAAGLVAPSTQRGRGMDDFGLEDDDDMAYFDDDDDDGTSTLDGTEYDFV